MIVRELRNGEEARWDEYVCTSEYSTPQHLSAWKQVMGEAFNSETHYLLAEENGVVTGILPLIHNNSLLAGHYATSMPGGLCAQDDETAGRLLDHAKEIVRATRARYLVLRDGRKKWDLDGLVTDEEHVTFVIAVAPNLDENKRAMKRNTRQLINQLSSNGISAVIGLANLDAYYPVYARAMQELGTPTPGYRFFRSLANTLPKTLKLITIQHCDKVIGGGFMAPLNQTVHCLWSGLSRAHYDLHISYLLSWESIRYAYLNDYRYVDLGRCRKNSGVYQFKKHFGGKVKQLYQQFYLNGVDQLPTVGAEMQESLRYRIFVSMWRRLPPTMTEALGPVIRKQVPFG